MSKRGRGNFHYHDAFEDVTFFPLQSELAKLLFSSLFVARACVSNETLVFTALEEKGGTSPVGFFPLLYLLSKRTTVSHVHEDWPSY